jgi:hypothetical protein
MNKQLSIHRHRLVIGLSALALLLALAALGARARTTAARAGSPPPDQPQFEGRNVSESFPIAGLADRSPAQRPAAASAWQILFEEDWEDGFDTGVWTTTDRNGDANGEYTWGVRDVANPLGGGDQSAWSIGGGADGQGLDVTDGGYPGGVDSWLVYGPLDLTDAQDAELSFNYRFHADAGDLFSVLVSTNGVNWTGKQTDDGGPGDWQGRNFALDEYIGEATVYVAFRFASNASGDNNKNAAYVDDIVLRADLGTLFYLPHVQLQPSATPTATNTPAPTATPTATPPAGIFEDNFTNGIGNWAARRSYSGAAYSVGHRDDADGGRQGALELMLSSTNSHVLVSPLIPAQRPPYNIEFTAKLKETKDRHMYGLVFGGDWNGGPCNAPGSANCFNTYYELRVQYRKFGNQEFQELKLKRIEGHDANGEPFGPTIQDWIKGGNVGADDWVEIDIFVQANGIMTLFWNGKYIAEVQDATLIDQPYFGLLLITRENGNARVKFDQIKID